MQVLQGQGDATDVERRRGAPRRVLPEDLRAFHEHVRQAASEAGLQQKVQVLLVHERLLEANDKGAVRDGQQLALPADLPLGAGLGQMPFGHGLERVPPSVAHVLHQGDLAETTPAESALLPQVLELDRLPSPLDPDGARVGLPAIGEPLAPLLYRAVGAGKVVAAEDLLQDLGDACVLEHQAGHAALARLHVGLGDWVAAHERALAEMVPVPQVRQPHLHLLPVGAILPHVLLGLPCAHDVPQVPRPLRPLLQDALPGLEGLHAVDVAGELVPLGAQERLQGMHLIEDLDVLRDLSVVMLAPPHELCPGDGEEYAILSDPEGGLPAQVVQHRQLPEAVPGHQDGHLVLRLRV
mmetsp:Transcript_103943/g.274792  ORF Transcript_103943/g.274792 Transcript_103943/m.274792 type:complete len:353 (+) Transcript_103943:935-1993(+)